MDMFITDMRIAHMSPVTMKARIGALRRLNAFLGKPLVEATADDLHTYQETISYRSPATVDIYTRHVRAFYAWAESRDIIDHDPSTGLILPRLRRGKPHPTRLEDLRVILAVSIGPLRRAYVLAAFSGLRCGEICRLRGVDISTDYGLPIALIHGKGGKERYVPLLDPVVDELAGASQRGNLVLNSHGRPYTPDALSIASHKHLKDLGIETTLHSMRGTFATHAVRMTRDPLFVRDLLGHASVATTELYMETSLEGAHAKLAEMSTMAAAMLTPRRLHAVAT